MGKLPGCNSDGRLNSSGLPVPRNSNLRSITSNRSCVADRMNREIPPNVNATTTPTSPIKAAAPMRKMSSSVSFASPAGVRRLSRKPLIHLAAANTATAASSTWTTVTGRASRKSAIPPQIHPRKPMIGCAHQPMMPKTTNVPNAQLRA